MTLYRSAVHPVPIDTKTYTDGLENLYRLSDPKYIEVLRSAAYGRGSLKVAPGLGLEETP